MADRVDAILLDPKNKEVCRSSFDYRPALMNYESVNLKLPCELSEKYGNYKLRFFGLTEIF